MVGMEGMGMEWGRGMEGRKWVGQVEMGGEGSQGERERKEKRYEGSLRENNWIGIFYGNIDNNNNDDNINDNKNNSNNYNVTESTRYNYLSLFH